ncbi:MAG TPA: ROK family protein [Spirochaetia bacterium]|nr:ROK family protein [Spirochaetia bacterium]
MTAVPPRGLVAADMGGSFLKFAVVVSEEPEHATADRTFGRVPMSDTEERSVADVLADAVGQALRTADRLGIPVSGIGVCSPGPFDWHRAVSLMKHKFLSIQGQELWPLVRARLPRVAAIAMRLVPDSYAFAAGERDHGAARDYSRCLYITLGTGIGSALSENGRIFLHLPDKSPDGSIWCAPYRDGITEDYVSKKAILSGYAGARASAAPRDRAPAAPPGDRAPGLDVADIAARARAGEEAALDVFGRFGRHLGAALRAYASGFDPQCIVIGGGLAPCFPLFESELKRETREMPGLSAIAVSTLGEIGPLLGIAATYEEGYREP